MRKPRKKKPGASYHVFARAVRGEKIFTSTLVKEIFMEVVRRAKKKYRFEIRNFCIMGSHYHLIMKPLENEDISKINQWINSVFARKFNLIYGYFGHVFAERFQSVIIHSFHQYLLTFIYVSMNPVKAFLVQTPIDYEYNGITFLYKGMLDIMERPPNWFLRLVWVLLQYGKEMILNDSRIAG
ncbi:MAG: transposase [Spirochaetales bacterium]|nr:transposase [Spirochaetales bacterium]